MKVTWWNQMVSYTNFKRKDSKHTSKVNLFKVSRNYRKNESKTKSDRFSDQMHIWVAYYRNNPHRFAKEFLGLNLHLFQAILLWGMMHHNIFMFIASRGLGKSFLSAVYLVTRCILYPGSKIVIAAGQKGQAIEVLLKIQDELMPKSNLLAREISNVTTSQQNPAIRFQNGSWIRVVTASAGGRGLRAHILLVDEFVLIEKDIVDRVLKPFLTGQRKPGFTKNPKYKDYNEPNKQMYLSSAWYKNHWGYDTMMAYTKKMTEGAKYFVTHLPYQVGIQSGIYDKQRIIDEMSEDTFNEISWAMEYEAKWYGESEKAYFKFKDLESNRKEPDALYPSETLNLVNGIKNPNKHPMEIRILSADIAVTGGAQNDASVFTLIQLKPNGKRYERYVTYMESVEGKHSEIQAIRIRQLMNDFDVDYLVIDGMGVGTAVIDPLMTPLYDEERGDKYEPITVMNDEVMAERCSHQDAEPVIFVIKATKNLNMEIAARMNDSLRHHKMHMLFKEPVAVEKLQKNSTLKYSLLDAQVKAELLRPFREIENLTHEMLNLETVTSTETNTFSLKEQGRMRKDRYTSISYGNYYASILERGLQERSKSATDTTDFMVFRKPKF